MHDSPRDGFTSPVIEPGAEAPHQVRDGHTVQISESRRQSIERDKSLGTLGPYDLLGVAGAGGMGVVYRARNRDLDRLVGLKILREDMTSQVDLDRFRREALLAASIDDPHVVPVYDAGSVDGRLYLAMKWIDGRTYTEFLAGIPLGPRNDPRAALIPLVPVFRALGKAHAAGIVHRDVKPGNILVDHEGHAYLADFGLARRAGVDATLTRTGTPMGTPAFMSPEQAMGDWKHLGPASDVFSAGVLLYTAFAGRPPFQATRDGQALDHTYRLLQAIAEQPVEPLRTHWPEVPVDLATIVVKALEKDPARRYADATGLADDLQRWLEGRSIVARPPGLTRRTGEWIRRHRTGVSTALFLGSAAFLFGRVLAWNSRVEAHRLEEARRETAVDSRFQAMLDEARLHREAGRLVDSAEAYARATTLAPSDSAAASERDRVMAGLEAALAEGLATAKAELDAGDRDAVARRLPEIVRQSRALGRRQDEVEALLARARTATGRVEVAGLAEGAEVLFRRIDPATRRIAADAEHVGSPWEETPVGDWSVEIRRPTFATLALLARVGSERGEDQVLLDVSAERTAGEPGMVLVSAGRVRLGAAEAAGGLHEEECDVAPFLLDACEVTNEEYARAVAAGAVPSPPHWAGPAPTEAILRQPVVLVTWGEASAYAAWRGKRLPTDREWERAGRWFDRRAFPWGNDPSDVAANAGGTAGPAAVGSHPEDRSPEGAFDLAGNVLEWTASEWSDPRYPDGRVVRGCSYAMKRRLGHHFLEHLATRRVESAGSRREFLGFRCARDVPR